MEDGKYHFHSRETGLFLDAYRNAAAIVHDSYGIVLIDGNLNGITISCQCLIDRIIYNLINQMVETSGRCAANIHARPFPDCLKSFQNLNLICSVLLSHVLYLPFFSGNQCRAVLVLIFHGSVDNFEYLVYMEPVVDKIIQPGTGNHGLDILYG